MAAGDLTIFEEAKLALLNGTHDLDTHTIKVCFADNTTTPTAAMAAPTRGSFTEVSGGNYVLGGDTMTVSLTEAGGTVTLDFTTDISKASDGANPSNIYWAIIYNDTAGSDEAIGFVEIDVAGFDASNGALTLTWGANIFTLS